MTPHAIVQNYWDGMITQPEALELLNRQQIRGQLDPAIFIGYDYCNQRWIELQPL